MEALGPAHRLVGLDLPDGWRAVEKYDRPPGSTGGTFSVGYLAESTDGERGFLKVLDYSRALSSPDTVRALEAMTSAYSFEKRVLEKCAQARLTRIVRAVSSGQVRLPDELIPVDYLIFERADGDVRSYRDQSDRLDLVWALRAIHHVANALQQLHLHGLAHQDVKPSNVLVFGGTSSKVADLGRASYEGHTAPHEDLRIAGDLSYAPPELLYGEEPTGWQRRRQACDMYLLGSLVLFFFTSVGATPAILTRLPREQRPQQWRGSYEEVLPYVRHAFDEVATELGTLVAESVKSQVVTAFRELCEPGPDLRGHPRSRAGIGSSFSLERYVATFDLIARRAELGLVSKRAA